MSQRPSRALLLLALLPRAALAIDTPLLLGMRDAFWARLRAEAVVVGTSYELTYAQPRDHFNVLTGGTWQQRVFVSETNFRNATGGPLFLNLGGEAAESAGSTTSGQIVELAALHGALVITLEHRYYGASQPAPNQTTDNLQWLSHEHALADAARFLELYVPTRWNVTRTIAFGGSYSGALAAWARVRAPHLIHAGFSTSGPVEPVRAMLCAGPGPSHACAAAAHVRASPHSLYACRSSISRATAR